MNATRLVLAGSFLSLVLGPGVARAQLDNPAYQVQPPVGFGIKLARIGEFTGDGIPDLVVSHFGVGQVSFFPGVGDGTFSRAVTRAASSSVAMEVGDLDLNGQADLVLGGSDFNVHLTSGDAELSAPYSLGGWNLSALHLADLNQDGLVDVVGVRELGDWFVWLNTTTFNGGNTQLSLTLADGHTVSSAQPVFVLDADFDEDGVPDLVIGYDTFGADKVFVYLGNGDGTFQAETLLSGTQFTLISGASGDFNGDGHVDLAVGGDGKLNLFFGDGTGGFPTFTTQSTLGDPRELLVDDLDSDGDLDVATRKSSGTGFPEMFFFANTGLGTFEPFRRSTDMIVASASNEGRFLARPLIDLDGDGSTDLVYVSLGRDVAVQYGNGDGTFGPPALRMVDDPQIVTIADFNEDGNPDLAVGDEQLNLVSRGAEIHLGSGDGNFALQPVIPLAAARLMVHGDFNGDGHVDLTTGEGTLLGAGDGSFQSVPGGLSFFDNPAGTRKLLVGDFDEDQVLDLVADAGFSDPTTMWARGLGDGSFVPGTPVPLSGPGDVLDAATADLDGDGHLDLALAQDRGDSPAHPSRVVILRGLGDGTFVQDTFLDLDDFHVAESVAVGDLDADGFLDVVVGTSPVFVFYGAGQGDFLPAVPLGPTGQVPVRSVDLADFDGDGRLDVATTDFERIQVILGRGAGVPELRWLKPLHLGRYFVRPGDVNGDGLVDLATAGYPSGAVLLNRSNHRPHADAGPDLALEATGPDGALVHLDGSASTDFDSSPGTNDDIVTFEWYEGAQLLGTGELLDVVLSVGTHTITLRVVDQLGAEDTDQLEVTVTSSIGLSLLVDPVELFPPNHRFVDVHVTATCFDPCVPPVILASVTSSEPDDAPGGTDGKTSPDTDQAQLGTSDFDLQLRAERDSRGSGRTYTLVYTASGGTIARSVEVFVPHNRGGITEPLDLRMDKTASGSLVRWTPVAGAFDYDVIRGDLDRLEPSNNSIHLGPVDCIENGVEDTAIPAPSKGFFYLVQYDDGRESGYGTESVPLPRSPISGGCQ